MGVRAAHRNGRRLAERRRVFPERGVLDEPSGAAVGVGVSRREKRRGGEGYFRTNRGESERRSRRGRVRSGRARLVRRARRRFERGGRDDFGTSNGENDRIRPIDGICVGENGRNRSKANGVRRVARFWRRSRRRGERTPFGKRGRPERQARERRSTGAGLARIERESGRSRSTGAGLARPERKSGRSRSAGAGLERPDRENGRRRPTGAGLERPERKSGERWATETRFRLERRGRGGLESVFF